MSTANHHHNHNNKRWVREGFVSDDFSSLRQDGLEVETRMRRLPTTMWLKTVHQRTVGL